MMTLTLHRNRIACAFLAAILLANSTLSAQIEPTASPTLEQRVAGLEAYLTNTDPAATLKTAKDKSGNSVIPNGLTSAAIGTAGPGANAWQMMSAALVLFMTLPGLFLFYGGLVRRKNVLSVIAPCYLLAGLVTILWWAGGYSLAFAPGSPFIGDLRHALLRGVTSAPNTDYSYWVSHNVFSMYQLMFAIITPALIIGAIAERMKFSAILVFMTLWMVTTSHSHTWFGVSMVS
jgi:Amt family ammonium transporter